MCGTYMYIMSEDYYYAMFTSVLVIKIILKISKVRYFVFVNKIIVWNQ